MSLEQDSRRGNEATRLLESEIYKESISGIRDAIHQKWEECPIRDTEAQHEFKLMLKLLKDLEANIKRFADAGKVANFEIESARKRDEMSRKVRRFA